MYESVNGGFAFLIQTFVARGRGQSSFGIWLRVEFIVVLPKIWVLVVTLLVTYHKTELPIYQVKTKDFTEDRGFFRHFYRRFWYATFSKMG